MHISDASIHPKERVLSVFSLVMINVIAVDSLRSLPIGAQYGFSLVFYYLLGGIFFFVPIALISAELSTGWPRIGGVYLWVSEAFGRRWGFLAIWLQWVYNIVWYPTILSFIAVTLAYLFDPALAKNKVWIMSIVLSSFWFATLLNCFGMKVSGLVSTIGAILGTLLPMLFIVFLGIVWLVTGHQSQVEFNWHSFLPDLSSINNTAYFVVILFGLLGMEMSAVHAEDVKNPRKDYPRALLISGTTIFTSLVLSSLAIAVVVPHDELSLVSGLIDAFAIFFEQFGIQWMRPVIIILVTLGAACGVSAWIIGPAKGLLAAAGDGTLPHIFKYTNEKGVPITILLAQAILFTLLCSFFVLVPSVNTWYWMLSALTAQLAMLVYLLMFAAGVRLRYSKPDIVRAFRIPGKQIGMWITALCGISICLIAIAVGFLPPAEIKVDNLLFYEGFLLSGLIIFCGLPLLLYRKNS